MFEKVNPAHPDKIADRIAGAIVDLAYSMRENPKVAVEVLIGHGLCTIIIESDVLAELETADQVAGEIYSIVDRIAGEGFEIDIRTRPQDPFLSGNQKYGFRCGDNGIFKGMPITQEQSILSAEARYIYEKYPYDGKYILDGDRLIICQSNARTADLLVDYLGSYPDAEINPLGDWTGGTDVDTGATNRKLGSDMGDSVTGGGLHGKDLSKADVSVNIYAWLKAQKERRAVRLCCAIGDTEIDGKPYSEIVEIARDYIQKAGGFEKFAEWGLI